MFNCFNHSAWARIERLFLEGSDAVVPYALSDRLCTALSLSVPMYVSPFPTSKCWISLLGCVCGVTGSRLLHYQESSIRSYPQNDRSVHLSTYPSLAFPFPPLPNDHPVPYFPPSLHPLTPSPPPTSIGRGSRQHIEIAPIRPELVLIHAPICYNPTN
ncbi:hypothetical protein FA13DRAFT_1739463 [Coprinellus micaceus]|uniref:Uncharacterized protein n=1 Tax=Coprinellus micaceus TaxID=71717 RepID=A0A4Y7SQG2_COPMI|nr:hypothetical protein FA13DRAFT_1740319 [Coprinellus micaceus]TEB24096.1 hypothetical protein FA13DRAFT_1739463 [Coprinellus micaceus]